MLRWFRVKFYTYLRKDKFLFKEGDIVISGNCDPGFYIIRRVDMVEQLYIIESTLTKYWLTWDKEDFEKLFRLSPKHNSALYKKLGLRGVFDN